MKKRILLVNDFSQLPSGYALYGRNLLEGLSKNYEVAELACYTDGKDPRIANCPWAVFPNKPTDPIKLENYNANPIAEHGDHMFNSVLLDWKPDYVLDFRDAWVLEFETRSPLRDYFSHVIMPTIDAAPNAADWIDYYAQADAILTYTEFGKDLLLSQTDKCNFIGIASPATSDFFHVKTQKEREYIKNKLSIPGNVLFGTVMRNQSRKLFADLFKAFQMFLDDKKHNNTFLYCHTSFPDLGWNIPELLMEYELTNRVLFTYRCKKCAAVTSRFFSDVVCFCESCGTFNNCIAGPNNGLLDEELCCIYNVMDWYIQLSENEGFGIPMIEAAACGVNIMGMPYSATKSILENLNGLNIPIADYSKEASTGRLKARPNIKKLSELLLVSKVFTPTLERRDKNSSLCKKTYSWNSVIKSWIEAIEKARPAKRKWNDPVRIIQEKPLLDIKGPYNQANYLVGEVFGRPEMIGSQFWRRLVKDLTYNVRIGSTGEYYYNESSDKTSLNSVKFSYEDAYNDIIKLVNYYNVWENHRISTL